MFETSAEAATLMGLQSTELTLWSDDKKKDFCAVFAARSKAAQYILIKSADRVLNIAQSRYFINSAGVSKIREESRIGLDELRDKDGYHHCGGRSVTELDAIAEERADDIIKELPGMIETWTVLKPDTAKNMRQEEEIRKALAVLGKGFEELPTNINMKDVDQSMTVGQFLEYVKDTAERRDALIRKMNKLAEQGGSLKRQIDKDLYSGNAELSRAVKDIVVQHYERATHLSATSRRVNERVMFGDSETALKLLNSFEEDEIKVDATIRAEFSAVMDKLGLKKKKRLAKGKKK